MKSVNEEQKKNWNFNILNVFFDINLRNPSDIVNNFDVFI